MPQTPREQQMQALMDFAFSEGRRAGLMRLSPNLNPYQPSDPLYAEWERARFGALTEAVRRQA